MIYITVMKKWVLKKLFKENYEYYMRIPIWLYFWKPMRKFINVVIIPNIPLNTLRIFLYRLVGIKIGKNAFIGMKCYLDDVDPSLTTIGNNVTISYACKFSIHGKNQGRTPIIIDDDVYIGVNATLISGKNGITIGPHAIIGACCLVNKSVPPHTTVVGVPMRVINTDEAAPRKSLEAHE